MALPALLLALRVPLENSAAVRACWPSVHALSVAQGRSRPLTGTVHAHCARRPNTRCHWGLSAVTPSPPARLVPTALVWGLPRSRAPHAGQAPTGPSQPPCLGRPLVGCRRPMRSVTTLGVILLQIIPTAGTSRWPMRSQHTSATTGMSISGCTFGPDIGT